MRLENDKYFFLLIFLGISSRFSRWIFGEHVLKKKSKKIIFFYSIFYTDCDTNTWMGFAIMWYLFFLAFLRIIKKNFIFFWCFFELSILQHYFRWFDENYVNFWIFRVVFLGVSFSFSIGFSKFNEKIEGNTKNDIFEET